MINFFFDAGFRLIVIHNIACLLYKKNRFFRILSYIIWQLEIILTSCHISLKCTIPKSTIFPHPTGIVIGDRVVIGRNVTIYQNVTLGAASMTKRFYPSIGNDCIIYAGAIVVGGSIVGDNAIVGANCFVNFEVPPRGKVTPPPSVISN